MNKNEQLDTSTKVSSSTRYCPPHLRNAQDSNQDGASKKAQSSSSYMNEERKANMERSNNNNNNNRRQPNDRNQSTRGPKPNNNRYGGNDDQQNDPYLAVDNNNNNNNKRPQQQPRNNNNYRGNDRYKRTEQSGNVDDATGGSSTQTDGSTATSFQSRGDQPRSARGGGANRFGSRNTNENNNTQNETAPVSAPSTSVPVVESIQDVPSEPQREYVANPSKFQSKQSQTSRGDDNNDNNNTTSLSNAPSSSNTSGGRFSRTNSYNPRPRRHNTVGERDVEAEKALFGEARTGIDFSTYDGIPASATGAKVPQPITSFSEISFGEHVEGNLKLCGYERPTPIQKYSLPIAMGNRDMIACAQTGSGKTAAFLLPIVYRLLQGDILPSNLRAATPQALILGPTRELVTQIYKEATKLTYRTSIKPVVVYGGVPIGSQISELSRGCHLLVATPGRLRDLCERHRVSLQNIQILIFDEADCMLDMGFAPQIEELMTQFDMPNTGRQTLMFSATFPPEIQHLASSYLKNYIYVTIGRVGSSTSLVTQKLISSPIHEEAKREQLLTLLNECDGLTLIFVETRRGADLLEQFLVDNDINAASIHGDRTQVEREQALSFFKSGHCPVLVATDVASRGLSIPNVEYVINYDMPTMIDDYVHRIGRTGRCGARGIATSFIGEKNRAIAGDLLDNMREADQAIPEFLRALVDTAGSRSYGSYGSYGSRNTGGSSRSGGGGYGSGGSSSTKNRFANVDVRYQGGNTGGGSSNNNQGSNSNPAPAPVANAPTPKRAQPMNQTKTFSASSIQPSYYGSSGSVINSVKASDDAW